MRSYILSPVLDLFNGEIIAYNHSKRPVYELVSEMLDKAFELLNRRRCPYPSFGSRLALSNETILKKHLKEHGITQSMSRKGNCLDNAVIENFFGLLKSELLYLQEFESMEHFKRELENILITTITNELRQN